MPAICPSSATTATPDLCSHICPAKAPNMLPISSVPMSRGLTRSTVLEPSFLRRSSHENLHPENDPEQGRIESEATRKPECPLFRTRDVTRSLTIVVSLWYFLICDRVNER